MKLFSEPALRQSIGLVIGLLVGIVGAILFQQSLPPEEGSVEEQLEESESDLRKARQEIAALRADGKSSKSRRTVKDGMRYIAERIRAGEEVSLDDLFWTMKPWLRDMSPLFDRIRQIEQEERFDSMAGEFSRKYGLSRKEQDELRDWLVKKGEENAKQYRDVIFSETSGFVDFARVNEFNEDDVDGIDKFMEDRLEGEKLEQFKDERLKERIAGVEDEANRRLQRLNEVVQLDDDQVDDMFMVMARGSKDFSPGMEFDGAEGEVSRLERGDRDAAIRGVLRGDQLHRYENYQAERRINEQRKMRRMGLALPQDWQLLDDDGF